jgi:hypothetical protein
MPRRCRVFRAFRLNRMWLTRCTVLGGLELKRIHILDFIYTAQLLKPRIPEQSFA